MASQSGKKTAVANSQTLKELHLISLAINVLALVCILVFRRPASIWKYLVLSAPAFGCQYVLESSGRPQYTVEAGQRKLVRSGDDIKGPGLFEYMFDTVYITWLCDVLMVVFGSNKVWWLYAVIPGYLAYKVSSVAKLFFGKLKTSVKQVPVEEEQKSKRQVKAEQRQKTQRVRAR